jgi:hypothetical protein
VPAEIHRFQDRAAKAVSDRVEGAASGSGKPRLSVSFHNFHKVFRADGSFFQKALSARYDVKIEKIGRDLQISSVYGMEPLPQIVGVRPLRVWWTAEAQDPRATIFDLHFGFRPTPILGTRWYRYPLWILFIDWWDRQSPWSVHRILGPRGPSSRSRFCNFIYSNNPSIRTEFFLRLNERRPVDSLWAKLAISSNEFASTLPCTVSTAFTSP